MGRFKVIGVRLVGDASALSATYAAASGQTRAFGRTVEDVNRRTRTGFRESAAAIGQNTDNLRRVGTAAVALGIVVGAVVGAAVHKFADFDQAMSSVQAATHETTGNMKLLREAAIEAGADTVFTATEAAGAIEELAKAGVTTADILGGGLKGSLDLASAGALGIAEAASIAATAMTQFRLQGKDLPHIADLLAAGAGKAQGSVSELGTALNYAGLPAAALGESIEETVGILTLFAKAGLVGDQAGTSLRGMLSSLVSPSEKAREVMEDLNIQLYDNAGRFLGMKNAADELQKRLAPLTDEERNLALGILFGNSQLQAANILVREGGDGVAKYTELVNDQGYAAETAALRLDNLRGDVEKLGGALDSALIQSGSGANSMLRDLTQSATGAVQSFSDLPDGVQQVALGIGAVGSSVLLAAGGLGILIPKVMETQRALEGMGRGGVLASRGLGTIGKAAGIVGVILTIGAALNYLGDRISALQGNGAPEVDELTKSLLEFTDTGKLTGAAMKAIGVDAQQLSDDLDQVRGKDAAIGKAASKTSGGLFGRHYTEAKDRIDALDASLTGLVNGGYDAKAQQVFGAIAEEALKSGTTVEDLTGQFPQYTDALRAAEIQADLAAGATGGLATDTDILTHAIDGAKQAALEAEQAIATYGEQLESNLTNISAAKSQIDLAEALIAVRDAAKDTKNSRRDDTATLLAFADQANRTADAVYNETDSFKASNKVLRDSRESFVRQATQMGINKTLIEEMADKFFHLPKEHATKVSLKGVQRTQAEMDRLQRKMGDALPPNKSTKVGTTGVPGTIAALGRVWNAVDRIPTSKTITTTYQTRNIGGYQIPTGLPNLLVNPRNKAGGGLLDGPGDGTSDSIPLWASRGEYVMRAAAVEKYGVHLFDRLNRMEGLPRFWQGGPVGRSNSAAVTVVRVPVTEHRTNSAPVHIAKVVAHDYDDFRLQLDREQRLQTSPGYLGASR